MKQIIVGGYYDLLNVATTEYAAFSGSYSWNGSISAALQMVSTPGTIRNLRVELDDVPGTGTYTFTLYRGVGVGAPAATTLTCTVAADGTTASDTAHDVTVAAGDVIVLECNPDSPDNARYARWTIEFEGDNANESLILAHSYSSKTATVYAALGCYSVLNNENDTRRVCPTAGKIKNLFIQLNLDPGTAPDAYKATLRIANAGNGYVLTDTALTCTITADDKTGNNVADEITVVAGDILNIKIDPLETPSSAPFLYIGMTFEADIDGESILWGGSSNNLSNADTEYNSLAAYLGLAWTATEAQMYQLSQECTFKKLYMLLSAAPGAGNSYTFTVRNEGASTGLTVAISGTDTTGNDVAHTASIADGDSVDLMVVPDSTPTVANAYWGLVCYATGVTAYERSLSTSIGLSSSLQRSVVNNRYLTTSIGVTPALERVKGVVRSLSTSIGLSPALLRLSTKSRSLSTSIGLSPSLTKSYGTVRSLTTSIGLIARKLSWRGKQHRRHSSGSTNRTIEQSGTNRTIKEVGDNRDNEYW
jgi:hypothetical protein